MKNKFAIITGGSRGIGLAIAKYLVRDNYDVALIARNAQRLATAKSTLAAINPDVSIETYPIDVSQIQQCHDLITEIIANKGNVDLVLNNAGILIGETSETSINDFMQMQNINVNAMFAVAKAAGQAMKKQRSGYIINIASMAGRRGLAKLGSYCATKFAVVGFSDSLAKELLSYGVKVTAICPSVIDTDMTKEFDMPNEDKIKLDDIVASIDYLLKLSPNAAVPILEIACSTLMA